jgi:hypothetical protein
MGSKGLPAGVYGVVVEDYWAVDSPRGNNLLDCQGAVELALGLLCRGIDRWSRWSCLWYDWVGNASEVNPCRWGKGRCQEHWEVLGGDGCDEVLWKLISSEKHLDRSRLIAKEDNHIILGINRDLGFACKGGQWVCWSWPYFFNSLEVIAKIKTKSAWNSRS